MNKNYNINTMKKSKTKSGKIAVIIGLLLILTSNLSFGQWVVTGNSSLSNIGSFPSTCVVDQNVIFVAGGDNTVGGVIYRSTNAGANFTKLSINGITVRDNKNKYRFFSCIYAKDANNIFVGDASAYATDGLLLNAKFYKTTNGGTNWTVVDQTGSGVYGFFNGIVFSKSNPQFGIAHCDPSDANGTFLIWKTTNGGSNWTKMSNAQAPNAYGAQNSLFVIDQNFFGFGLNISNARVAITTNGGTNWNYYSLNGATSTQGFISTVTFNDDKLHGYAAVSSTNNFIWKTTNGGQTWDTLRVDGVPNNASGQANIKYISGTNSAFYVLSSATTGYSFKILDNGAEFSPYVSSNLLNVMHVDSFYQLTDKAVGEVTTVAVTNTGSVLKLQDSPLPVTLASFTYAVSGRNVNLKWVTSSEQNNSGFEVYRIFGDANRSITSNWTNIGFIQGKGNVTGNTEYNFTDKNLSTGKYYYRIKQVDYNGNYEYFDLNGSADIGAPSKVSLGQNYPNPFNPVTNIGYEIPQDARVTMKVYDITGREISTLVNETQAAGYHTVKFDASKYSSGMYFYKVVVRSANGTVSEYTKTMSVVK